MYSQFTPASGDRRTSCSLGWLLPPACQSLNRRRQLPLTGLRAPFLCPSRRVQCSVDIAPCHLTSTKGIGKFVDLEVKVREYELDQYGVVNNAVYSNYFQYAIAELLERLGVNVGGVALIDNALAFSELSMKFLAPLRSGDKFVARVRPTNMSAARVHFEIFIYKLPNLEAIFKGKATGVWIDRSGRPCRIPPEVKYKMTNHGLHACANGTTYGFK